MLLVYPAKTAPRGVSSSLRAVCHATMLALIAAAAHALSIPHRPAQCVLGRRGVLLATTAAVVFPSSLAAAEPDDLVAVGSVRIKPGVAEPAQDGGALYVTVRVIPSNNVGTYVTAGKVPPLATARIASPISFPYEVRLTLADLTPEYAGVPRKEWQQQDLTISARWDTDGTAATCAATTPPKARPFSQPPGNSPHLYLYFAGVAPTTSSAEASWRSTASSIAASGGKPRLRLRDADSPVGC